MKHLYSVAVLLLFSFVALAQSGKQLHLLHTSDMHSRIESIATGAADENAGTAGMARRASFVKQYRSLHPDVLLFDGGDISQGTPYYNLFQGEVEMKLMNHIKYDVVTIGNHEFDFGMENLARLYRMAHFPVVCANYDVAGTVLQGLVKPYVVLERGGARIGVFGVSPPLKGLVQLDKCEGVIYRDPILAAQETADLLREKERCDVVICLSHMGIVTDQQLANQTSNIDVILGGHSHTFMENPLNYLNAVGKDVSLLHTGKNGIYVGQVVLTLTKR